MSKLGYTVSSSADLESGRLAIQEASSRTAAGVARQLASAEISSNVDPDSPVLVMGFGNKSMALNSQGDVLDNDSDKVKGLGKGWKIDVDAVSPRGSVPTNKVLANGLHVPAGVALVVGAASTAKTPLVHLLAASGVSEYATIRYGEPLAGYIVDEMEAALAIGQCLLKEKDIVLDSVKDLLATASGGAMASGLSRGALPLLSDLSALAATVGSTLYVPINPSTTAENIVEMVVEAAKSNVAMTIVADPTYGPNAWLASIRKGEGLEREVVLFEASFHKGSLIMHMKDDQVVPVQGKTQKILSNVKVKDSTMPSPNMPSEAAFDAALRRHFKTK